MIHDVADAQGLIDAFAIAVAGDAIVVSDGTYRLPAIARSRSPGAKDLPILVRSKNYGRAIIESNGNEEAIWLGHTYWRIDGLVIRATNGSNYGIKLEGAARYCMIRGCTIEIGDRSECAIKGAGAADPRLCPDGATIEDNIISMPTATSYGLAEGIDAVACNGWLVRGNKITGIKTAAGGVAFGIVIKGNASTAWIERNVVDDCFIAISLGGGGTGAQWVRHGDASQEARSCTVRGNIMSRSIDVGLYLYSVTGTKVHSNWIFESCMKQGPRGTSIDVRMPGVNNDIAMCYLDKPIRARDGGVFASRSNCIGPADALGVVSFRAR